MTNISSEPIQLSPVEMPVISQKFPRLSVIALGLSLGVFLMISFTLCVLFDLAFPSLAMNPVWALLLPGFTWLSWGSFALGLVESFAYGVYVALIFGPLFNYFSARQQRK